MMDTPLDTSATNLAVLIYSLFASLVAIAFIIGMMRLIIWLLGLKWSRKYMIASLCLSILLIVLFFCSSLV